MLICTLVFLNGAAKFEVLITRCLYENSLPAISGDTMVTYAKGHQKGVSQRNTCTNTTTALLTTTLSLL